MVPASVSLIAFLALIVWRLMFTGLRCALARGIATRNQPYSSSLEEQIHRHREDRAETYLRRIVALTGATQIGNSYVLNVGTTQFTVCNRYVGRLRDATDPKCIYRETCFYSAHREMPKAEQIATALLQLKNNPVLFEKWVAQSGLMFKADGTSVQPRAMIGWR